MTRQVFTGAGKVGRENGADPVDFQISQRADFFEEEVGLETTLKRPIVNTRDEPHADPQKYRRLHVIVGDANLCEVATFLKVGTTAIVLSMIEDGFVDKDLTITRAGPRDADRLARPHVSRAGRARRRRTLHRGRDAVGVPAPRRASTPTTSASRRAAARRSARLVLDRWEATLADLERDPTAPRRPARLGHEAPAAPRVRRARRPALGRPEAELLDLQYHDVRPERSLYERLVRAGKVERLVTESEVISRDEPIRPTPPGRISGAPASGAGRTRSSPRTGTVSSST